MPDPVPENRAPESQAREFAAAFRVFLDWIHSAGAEDSNEVQAGPGPGAAMAMAYRRQAMLRRHGRFGG